jgi:hypothetical protein
MDANAETKPAQPAPYEPPRLTDLGTLAELTRGVNPTTTDGLTPGSTL